MSDRHISDADLQHLRAALDKKREDLLASRRATSGEERGVVDGRETEDGDVAERLIEQEAALRVGAFDAALLADVERALKKIEDGNYGTSEESGAPIPLDRLRAVPWARRTAAEEEKRGR